MFKLSSSPLAIFSSSIKLFFVFYLELSEGIYVATSVVGMTEGYEIFNNILQNYYYEKKNVSIKKVTNRLILTMLKEFCLLIMWAATYFFSLLSLCFVVRVF